MIRLNESQVRRLVTLAQSGNHEAIKTLLRAFRPFRKRLANKFSINEFYKGSNVEDINRQVDFFFTSAVLDYDPSFNSPAILHIVSKTNRDMLDFYRKELIYQERFVSYGGLSDMPSGPMDDTVTDIEMAEIRADIANALKGCRERDKKIFLLYFYEELTQEEIAVILGISRARVQRSIARTRKILQSYLNIK
mgnify:CR=1 FL=1